ncbi:MAG: sensor histidine kinase [Kiritimatiellales bacterium]
MMLSDRGMRYTAAALALILLGMLLISQLFIWQMSESLKKTLILHDYAVAGVLDRIGVDQQKIAAAFTTVQANGDEKAGGELLLKAGYGEETQRFLIPAAEHFYRTNALAALGVFFVCAICLTIVLYRNVRIYLERLEMATENIHCFLEGNTKVRLEDCGEGSMSRLFSAVNIMATSLTAHIEREKNNKEFLKDIISDISHQLKTPLAALNMYHEIILEENPENPTVVCFLEKSKRELNRMEVLIQNLLKLARLDAGTIALESIPHKLKTFLEDCISVFRPRAALEGKTINLSCEDSFMLCFDQLWLGEAVGNLIKNALDHTAEGDWLNISCEETAVATVLRFCDSGSGIHSEDLHNIFKRFYRSRFSKDSAGIGIGLSLTKAIVEKHGGTVTVNSEFGRGAEFRLVFPKLTKL